MSKKMIFSDAQKSDIVKKYMDEKMTIDGVALGYGISVTPIKRVLKELNILIRKPSETSRKYFVDDAYFDYINSNDKAYFLGLLMADGYNHERRGVITLILVDKDRDILEKFRQHLKSTRSVISYQNKPWNDICKVEFSSKNISQKLAQYGCMQAKTFKLKFPTYLRKDLVRHFIRGYFDGDGCLSYTFAKRANVFGNSFLSVVTITSTDDFCLHLSQYIKGNLNINSTLLCRHPERNNNNRTLQISGNKQVIRLMDWLYANTDLYLKRKYDKLLAIKDIIAQRDLIVHKIRAKNGLKVMTIINDRRNK